MDHSERAGGKETVRNDSSNRTGRYEQHNAKINEPQGDAVKARIPNLARFGATAATAFTQIPDVALHDLQRDSNSHRDTRDESDELPHSAHRQK